MLALLTHCATTIVLQFCLFCYCYMIYLQKIWSLSVRVLATLTVIHRTIRVTYNKVQLSMYSLEAAAIRRSISTDLIIVRRHADANRLFFSVGAIIERCTTTWNDCVVTSEEAAVATTIDVVSNRNWHLYVRRPDGVPTTHYPGTHPGIHLIQLTGL